MTMRTALVLLGAAIAFVGLAATSVAAAEQSPQQQVVQVVTDALSTFAQVAQRSRRGFWDDDADNVDDFLFGDDDDNFFDFACFETPAGIKFGFTCAPRILNAIQPLLDDLRDQAVTDCIENPDECLNEDFEDIEGSFSQYAELMKQVVQSLCDASDCWSQFLNLIPQCVNLEDLLEIPEVDLYVDQFVSAAETLCVTDENGDSCGAKLIEFAMAEDEILAFDGEDALCTELAAENPTCDNECRTFLSAVDDELGCCYAEAVRALDDLPDHIVDPDMLFDLSGYWKVCGVPAPAKDCSNHKVPAVTGGSGSSHGDDDDDDDDDDGGNVFFKMSSAELIGVIAGGCVLVALIVGIIIYAVRRSRSPREVQYMPVHTQVDDDWSVN